MEEKPRFVHDCPRCTFLGWHDYDGQPFDLYWCPQSNDGMCETIVARFGNDGGDYLSGIRGENENSLSLAPIPEGIRRARARGLGFKPEIYCHTYATAYSLMGCLISIEASMICSANTKVLKTVCEWCDDEIRHAEEDEESERAEFYRKGKELIILAFNNRNK